MAIEIVSFPIQNGGSFHSYGTVYQRVWGKFPYFHICPTIILPWFSRFSRFSHVHFPMIFPHFPMIFPYVSRVFPLTCQFPMIPHMFLWFSYDFRMIFPYFPMIFHIFPMDFPPFSTFLRRPKNPPPGGLGAAGLLGPQPGAHRRGSRCHRGDPGAAAVTTGNDESMLMICICHRNSGFSH